ncbi:UNC93-like protein MFSD11 [Tetranychus urticae]|uniref:UNC93-like protein MFSD11 n=1 Tax=Tetranychus urticae TaxID=32264 RepID=T1KL21_TETUR|nr:UNC93-like protein MFSD11 [Tetranychus urticae]
MTSDDKILPLRPIILYGVVYFFIILPFFTFNNVQELVADSINEDYEQAWNGFKWSGYISLSILNWTGAVFSWFTPPLISLINSKRALALGAFGFNLALGTFLFPFKYGLYIASAISGISASLMWNAQGTYLSFTSNGASATRDAGIMWSIMQSGAVFGNVAVTYLFQGKEHISVNTRTLLYSSLISVGIIGIMLTFFLKKPDEVEKSEPVFKVFGQAIKLMTTKRMALLCIFMLYTGLELSFFNTIYPTSVGYTKAFGVNRKQYAGETGMLIGAGQVAAGILLIVSRRMKKPQYILVFAYVVAILTYVSIYVNLPNNASTMDTDDPAIIHPSLTLAFVNAFALGFTDGCFETQIGRCIITYYSNNAAPPFAIYTSLQGVSMGIMYLLSDYIGLHLYCILLLITCTIGISAFFFSFHVKDTLIITNESREAIISGQTEPNCDLKN